MYVPPESALESVPTLAAVPAGAVEPVIPDAGPPHGEIARGVTEVIVRVPAVSLVAICPLIISPVVVPDWPISIRRMAIFPPAVVIAAAVRRATKTFPVPTVKLLSDTT